MRSSTADHRSDEQLVESVRDGDAEAFGELWRRHSRSGRTVASRFTSSLDADDLVSEAFASIYQNTRAGGGPLGAFRPYLYTTIRNLACTWGRSRREVAVDDLTEVADPASLVDVALEQLDSALTAEAFHKLPTRWQTVLWYTEVEGMDPHEVAPLLGLTPNGVAALAYRAREGLRSSFLQAHVTEATESASCRWTIERLGDHARRHLGKRDRTRVDDHLAVCARCTLILAEVDDVGARIAAILAPTLIGGGLGAGLLEAGIGHPTAATATAASVAHTAAGAVAHQLVGAPGALVASASGAGLFSGPVVAMSALVVAATVAGSSLVGAVPVVPGQQPIAHLSEQVSVTSDAPVVSSDTSEETAEGTSVLPSEAAPSVPPALVVGIDPSSGTTSDPAAIPVELPAGAVVPGAQSGPVAGVADAVSEVVDGVTGTVSGVTDAVDDVTGTTEVVVGSVGEVVHGTTGAVGRVADAAVPAVVGGAVGVVDEAATQLPLPLVETVVTPALPGLLG